MALNVLESNLLHIDTVSRRFVVRGPGEPYFVCLFPQRKCQCGSTTTCFHLLAVEMFLGLTNSSTKKPGNIMLLRKRGRNKADSRSGRKRPRVKDTVKFKEVICFLTYHLFLRFTKPANFSIYSYHLIRLRCTSSHTN